MKKIYLVLSSTGTTFSKMIRKHTGDRFNHVSIAFKEDLSEMYSFGRKYACLFFYGGFVVEGKDRGTFKRFEKTEVRVFELTVSEESYCEIERIIARFLSEKKKFSYNFKGVLKARENLDYQKSERSFYCSQFVARVLTTAKVIPEDFFNGAPIPNKFQAIEGLTLLYEGLLRDYVPVKDPIAKS